MHVDDWYKIIFWLLISHLDTSSLPTFHFSLLTPAMHLILSHLLSIPACLELGGIACIVETVCVVSVALVSGKILENSPLPLCKLPIHILISSSFPLSNSPTALIKPVALLIHPDWSSSIALSRTELWSGSSCFQKTCWSFKWTNTQQRYDVSNILSTCIYLWLTPLQAVRRP